MTLKRAHVVSAGRVSLPNRDGVSVLEVLTDYPWAEAGERYTMTGIYLAAPWPDPLPKTGEPIAWDGHDVTFRGTRWDRVDHEFNPDPGKPFH